MNTIYHIAACLARCNPHPCLYIALATPFVLRGATALSERRWAEAREPLVHALLYLALGLT